MCGKLFIDIGGKSEYLSEEEVEERLALQPELPMPTYTKEDIEKAMEEQYILKTKMTLQKEELFTAYVQEFDFDDYHKDNTDIPSELERQVRNLKRRYPDFSEYQSAILVYNEYMSYLYAKHGGKEIFDLKEKGGFIKEYVPAQPKIKTTSTNKQLLKNKIVISPKSKSNENYIDIEDLDYEDILEITATEDSYTGYIEYDRIKEAKPNKEFDKFVEKQVLGKANKFSRRAESIMLRSSSSIEYLDEYFKTKNALEEEKNGSDYNSEELTLEDIMNGNYVTEEDLKQEADDKVYKNGRIMGREQANEIETYDKLRDSGWDVQKILRRSGNISESDVLFKRLKQIDKREKKKKKGKKDNFLTTMSSDNGYDDFEAFARDMMDFSSDNIFK